MEQNKIWEHFQNNETELFQGNAARLNYLVKRIAASEISVRPSVLNIGVGNGYFEKKCLERKFEIFAMDPDVNAVQKLAREGVIARSGLITDIPFDNNSFDFVVASEVLEHLTPEETLKAIENIKRVLKPNSYFLATVPFQENLSDNQAVCPHCGTLFHRWGHQQSFTVDSFKSVISSQLLVENVKVCSFVEFKGRSALGKLKSLVKLVLGSMGEKIADPHIFISAKKS